MRKENSDFSTKFISEAGSYLINADYFAFVELKDYACYVIADGIDPDEKKESAKLAVTTVITEFSEAPGMSAGKLNHFLKAAHETLLRESEEIRLEASIVVLLTDYKKAIWGHAGNSRLCWIRNGEIKTVTKDTSLTQRMADEEEIPIDQIAEHEERNNLYTYLGQPGRFTPVISAKKKLEDGDIFILMTRGVWENVGNAEIIDAVDGVSKAEDVCTGLEDVILSQRLEIIENYTIASVFINKIYQNPKAGRNKKILRIVFTVCFALTMLLVSLLIARYIKTKNYLDKMEVKKADGIERLLRNEYQEAYTAFSAANDEAEKIKARSTSKTGKRVSAVKAYKNMSEYVIAGKTSILKERYDKAIKDFTDANKKLAELKENRKEDVSAFEEEIEAFLEYAECMKNASEFYAEKDWQNSVEEYKKAVSLMSDGLDEDLHEFATIKMNDALAKDLCRQAQAVYDDALSLFKGKKDLVSAEINFILAKNLYLQASELGDPTAASNAITAGDFADKAHEMLALQSDEEKEATAENLIKAGKESREHGDKTTANEKLNLAEELISEINSDRAKELRSTIENERNLMANDPEQELINAIDYLTNKNYDAAIEALTKAKEAYKELGNSTREGQMEVYIRSINNLIKSTIAP